MIDRKEAQATYNQQLRTMLGNIGRQMPKPTIWQRFVFWWTSR